MGFLDQPITLQGLFGTKRMIGPIVVQLVVSEDTEDTRTITKQPLQTGAPATDHSYQEPTVLSMVILQQDTSIISGLLSTFNGGGLAQIYKTFRDLQLRGQPFNVVTRKRIYKNVLIPSIRCHTDKNTENILSLTIAFQEVIFVTVGNTVVPAARQKKPASTAATQNIGKQSFLLTGKQAVTGFFGK
jgi:hypothetical protein